jgi:hypothetical protein
MKEKNENKYFWELAIIIGLFIITASLILNYDHKWGGDFSAYIMQADALLNHSVQQYLKENSFIVFNSNVVVGPSAYPWGYPLVLLPVYSLFGLNPILLKLPNILFFALFLLFLDLYLKDKTETRERMIIILSL